MFNRQEYLREWRSKNKDKEKSYWKKKQERNKLLIKTGKDKPCKDCGQLFPPYCMDYDHRDPTKKFKNVAVMVSAATSTLLKEIQKCDVVCANCHRIRTHGRVQ